MNREHSRLRRSQHGRPFQRAVLGPSHVGSRRYQLLVYLLIEGDRTSSAQELYAHDSDWRSEAFILVELSNVLATYVRNRALPLELRVKLVTEEAKLLAAVPSLTCSLADAIG